MTDAGRGKVMVVDDDPAVVAVLAEYLQREGFDVVTATDGPEALERLSRDRPHTVLLDVRMPGMNGVEVLRKIREVAPRTGVLMVTANEDSAVAKETLALGAFDYILKPVDLDYLGRTINRLLLSASLPGARGAPEPTAGAGALYELALELFKATRELPPAAHASIGAALEAAGLSLIQKTLPGDKADVIRLIHQIRTLIRFGRDLGDFVDDRHRHLESCVAQARRAVGLG